MREYYKKFQANSASKDGSNNGSGKDKRGGAAADKKTVAAQPAKKEESKQFVAKEEQKKGGKLAAAQSSLAGTGKKSPRTTQYERKLSQSKTAAGVATQYSQKRVKGVV